MRSCFYLLIIFAALFISSHGQAQSLMNIRNRPYYTYVYRINAAQALQIAKAGCNYDNPEYFTQQVDSFLTDNGIPASMPNGHYIFAAINSNMCYFSLKYYGGLDAEIIPDNRQLMIRVMRNQQVVPDAIVSFGGKQLKWRSELNAYAHPNTTRNGVISVVQGGDTAVFLAYNDLYDPWKPLRKTAQIALYAFYPLKIVYGVVFCPVYTFNYLRFHDKTRNNLHYGYSLTNQPMYRHGDTLKWKAYVVDRNGNPLKKKAKIYVSATQNYRSNNYKKEFVLKPTVPGSYSFEMPITDSMQLDYYNIRFAMKRLLRTVDLYSLNKPFTVADYQLSELQGDFWTEKRSYCSGEPVTIFLKANDVLGFPARDARVSIIAATDSFCVDGNKETQTSFSQVFWSTDLTLKATGENNVVIPGSALPKNDVRVTLMVLFYNSNNESHRIIKMFDVNKTAPPFQYSVDANTLSFTPVIDSEKYAPIEIEAQNAAGKPLFVQSLQAPDTMHVNALVNRYIASSGNYRDTIMVSTLPDRICVDLTRTADSVFVKILNPDQLQMHLVVYRNKKEIYAAHAGGDFEWSTVESSVEPYFISVSYYFGEELRNQRLSLYALEKQLKVSLNQPDAVLPGEEKMLTVQVTDYENNPVENVNLTAFSVNSQFDRNNTISIPYLGESRKQKRKTEYTMYRANTTTWKTLNQYWLHKSNADTMLFYRFRYPEGGVACMYDSCLSDNAQFAPFIYGKHGLLKVYYIKLDDTLVYYDGLNYEIPFSFIGSEGWHSMSIRTQQNLIQLDSVYLKHGSKLNLCINTDSASAHVTASKERKVISRKEDFNMIKGCINVLQMSEHGWFWQDDRLFLLPDYSGNYYRNLVGPFRGNSPVNCTSYSSYYGKTSVDADSVRIIIFHSKSTMQYPGDICEKQRLYSLYYDFDIPLFSDTACSVRAFLNGEYDSIFINKNRYYYDGCYRHNYEVDKMTIMNDSSFAQYYNPGMNYNDYIRKPIKYRRGRRHYYGSYNPGFLSPRRSGHQYKLRGSSSFRGVIFPSEFKFNTEASYDESSAIWAPDQSLGLDNPTLGADSLVPGITWSDVRSNFRDCAFWIPDLTTNSAGEASFWVSYPDNITRWSSYVYAMNNRRQSGIDFDQTNAFKLMFATLSMPRFLLVGDSADIVGKITNLSPDKHSVTSQFILQGRETVAATYELNTYIKSEAQLVAGSQDSLKVRFGFSSAALNDAEELTIPVLPVGVYESHGKFAALEGDTTFTWKFNPDSGAVKIYADGNYLRLMLEDLQKLRYYPYDCNEQLASKLKTLLMIKEIDHFTGQYFSGRQDINKILKKLEKNKSTNDAFGWWPGNVDNTAITIYVADALNLAAKQDYQSDFRDDVLWHLKTLLSNNLVTNFEKLSIMRLLIESDDSRYENFDFNAQLETFNIRTLNTIEKLAFIRVKQLLHQEYQLSDVISIANRTTLGGIYWSGNRDELFSSDIQATILAYSILKNDSAGQTYLPKVRGYFYELKQRGQWMNTIEAASVLYTILPDVLQQKSDLKNAGSIIINGVAITEFPFEVTATDKVVVEKTGHSPVFLTAYQTTWSTRSEAVDKDFKVQTYFSKTLNNSTTVKAAEPVLLIVEVKVKGPAQYVMIEVPIPAGCSYGNNLNRENKYEVHREYFKDKTSIFCKNLPAGTYRFEIELQPRYTGSYTLNPAKAELMYFPVFFGRERLKKVKISDGNTAR